MLQKNKILVLIIFSFIFGIDSDGDGLVGKQDLYCPDTPQGETVDADGCSESDLAGSLDSEKVDNSLGENIEVAN